MGISSLNHLLRDKARDACKNIKLRELTTGSRIAIDWSIMMYNIKNMTLKTGKLFADILDEFVKNCTETGLKLVFVIDGKAGPEKAEEWSRRYEERTVLLDRMTAITNEIKETSDEMRIGELTTELAKLEELTINVKSEERRAMLDHLVVSGCIVLYATGEADPLLATLAKRKYVDYVLSRDTDMLAYGCPRVLREKLASLDTSETYFDLDYELVEFDKMLIELRLSRAEFVDMCILAGCDYFKAPISTGKYDKYWIMAVFSSIKRINTIERIRTSGELRRTFGLNLTDDDLIKTAQVRTMFTELGTIETLAENASALE